MGAEFRMQWFGPFDSGLKIYGSHEGNDARGWEAGAARCLRNIALARAEAAGVGVTTCVLAFERHGCRRAAALAIGRWRACNPYSGLPYVDLPRASTVTPDACLLGCPGGTGPPAARER